MDPRTFSREVEEIIKEFLEEYINSRKIRGGRGKLSPLKIARVLNPFRSWRYSLAECRQGEHAMDVDEHVQWMRDEGFTLVICSKIRRKD